MHRISYGVWAFFLALTEVRAETTLDLPYCLDEAMGRNRALLQAREAIHQIEGHRIVVRSRFMPHLDLTASYDAPRPSLADSTTDDQFGSTLRFSQRLFEFGPHFAQEVQVREALRQAVYAYEALVYQELAQVWALFHLIVLQDRQLALRRASRDDFQAALVREQARFDRQLATESDRLNAQLNVLDEELAINNLERAQFNNKMDLLRRIGQPIGTDIHLAGAAVEWAIEQDRAVELALANSVALTLTRAQFKEQKRVVREVAWEYAPDLTLNVGVQDGAGQRKAQLALDKQGPTWGLDLSSELALRDRTPPAVADETRWSAHVEARLPIFAGARFGRKVQEKARLRQLEIALRALRAETELNVRQAYQQVLEAEGRQRIQAERVKIARRRLEISQILKEQGDVNEHLLETFRNQFFAIQDQLFKNQETFIRRRAALRRQMGHFE